MAAVNPKAAAEELRAYSSGPEVFTITTRLGEQRQDFAPHEVRRIIIGRYELRYELVGDKLIVLRLWNTREAH